MRGGTHFKEVAREKSYRLIVEDLPSTEKLPSSGLRIITKVSIPIFIQPSKIETTSIIDQLNLRTCELFFATKNFGNVYIPPHKIRVSGISAGGDVPLGCRIIATGKFQGACRGPRVSCAAANLICLIFVFSCYRCEASMAQNHARD